MNAWQQKQVMLEYSRYWKNVSEFHGYSGSAKVMVGEPASTLAQIKPVPPNCAGNHCILHCHALTVKKKGGWVSLKNVLDETVKMTDFIKSWPF